MLVGAVEKLCEAFVVVLTLKCESSGADCAAAFRPDFPSASGLLR